MIDAMRLAGFATRTQDVYIQAIRRLAAHYMRSPEVLSEEEVRTAGSSVAIITVGRISRISPVRTSP
jgi:hypothetical protein